MITAAKIIQNQKNILSERAKCTFCFVLIKQNLAQNVLRKGNNLFCRLYNAFSEGGDGAVDMARLVVDTIENNPSEPLRYTYKEEDSIQQKIEKVATNLYGASVITYSSIARNRIKLIEKMGITHYPVCIAKTQYSFSADPKIYGAVNNFEFHIKDIVINNGAEMIVAIAGEILRMPGLPKEPQALHIDIVDGEIEGLS